MNKAVTLIAALVSTQLWAAQEPFFKIVEIEDGGYATQIAPDNSVVSGIAVTNDPSPFFTEFPFADFTMDRFRFERGCIQTGDVCDAYWEDADGLGYDWRVSFLNGDSQRYNIGDFTEKGDELSGLVTAIASEDTYAGYKFLEDNTSKRETFAVIGGSAGTQRIELKAPYGDSLSVPTQIIPLADGRHLVAGTAAVSLEDEDWVRDCFDINEGDTDDYGDYEYCPGYNTQAMFWVINDSSKDVRRFQPSSWYDGDNDVIQTASANAVANVAGTYYGAGYSTIAIDDGDQDGRNVAMFWQLNLTTGSESVSAQELIPLPGKVPTDDENDDEPLRHSWAVDINSNGFVIGNQRYEYSKNQNIPTEMFVYRVNGDTAKLPLEDDPIDGANSEAAAINDYNMVVGWRDSRHQTQPVDEGTSRMQEAFLLNAENDRNWYLNDLICGLDDAQAKVCSQNGAYYHIAYAADISPDGTIAATAYRYTTLNDWQTRQNATVVAIKMEPQQENYTGIPSQYVVANEPAANQTAQDKDDGDDSGSLFWLTLLALPLAWVRRKHA